MTDLATGLQALPPPPRDETTLMEWIDSEIARVEPQPAKYVETKRRVRERKAPGYTKKLLREEKQHSAALAVLGTLREVKRRYELENE